MAEHTPKPVKVLVVEDSEDDYHYLAMLLLRATVPGSYEVGWASSYDQGKEAVRSGRYDVGLFDYRLGGGTGLDLLREVHEHDCEMPIILLTGYDSTEVDHEASRTGAADYLCKVGLTTTELERAIRYAVRQASMLSELRRTTRLLNGVLSSLPVMAARVDRDGKVLESRGHGLEIIGLREGELVGTNIFEAYPAVAADIRRATEGGEANFTWTISHGGKAHYFDNYFRFDEESGREAIGFSVNVTARVEAEEERNRQARLLQSVLNNLPVIAGRLDASGRVVEVQGSGLANHEIGPKILPGHVFTELYPHCRESIAAALRGEAVNFTLNGHEGGEEWHMDFFVSYAAEQGGGATFFGRDVTERRCLEQQLLTVSDAEQRRIGADLHDGLGQHLTGLACLSAALRDRLKAGNPAEAEQAGLIARLANEATEQSRALARGLSPVQLEEHGLSSALEDLTFQSQRLHRVECTFSLEGKAPECDHMTSIHLYRITQEAIHNAVRHGEATRIQVTMVSTPAACRLQVIDNGKGFDPRRTNGFGSRGLKLMAYRAAMIGAVLTVHSAPGEGARIECLLEQSASIPYENQFCFS
ncbi:MAG: PAS domain-containing protein [Verrucomicrobia bacterium]|nr:PAS domain-containing protein [Verrucomicrobiota bacterium]